MGLMSIGFPTQRRIKDSDIAAFEALFREYYPRLCRFAWGLVKDMDCAEEIVQEFFYNYWKNREKIQIRFSVKSYLFSSVRNLSLKYLEQQEVRRRYADRILASENEPQAGQLEAMQARELERIIGKALEDLPGRCRQVFALSRQEGKKYQEIAAILGISVKTVEADIAKVLKHLRKRLADYQKEPVRKI